VCEMASFLVTRDRVLWSPIHDSHVKIAKEHSSLLSSAEMVASGRLAAVSVEVVPPNLDYSRPLEEWRMRVDGMITRAILPDWWDETDVRRRCADTLAEWAKHHILSEGVHDRTGEFTVIVKGTAVLNATGQTGGICRAYSGGTVNATGQTGGDCWAYSGGTVNATGQTGGHCPAYSGGTVNATGQTGGHCWADLGGTVNATP